MLGTSTTAALSRASRRWWRVAVIAAVLVVALAAGGFLVANRSGEHRTSGVASARSGSDGSKVAAEDGSVQLGEGGGQPGVDGGPSAEASRQPPTVSPSEGQATCRALFSSNDDDSSPDTSVDEATTLDLFVKCDSFITTRLGSDFCSDYRAVYGTLLLVGLSVSGIDDSEVTEQEDTTIARLSSIIGHQFVILSEEAPNRQMADDLQVVAESMRDVKTVTAYKAGDEDQDVRAAEDRINAYDQCDQSDPETDTE
jgi:hypothetical protein